jgi:hypothetical protein
LGALEVTTTHTSAQLDSVFNAIQSVLSQLQERDSVAASAAPPSPPPLIVPPPIVPSIDHTIAPLLYLLHLASLPVPATPDMAAVVVQPPPSMLKPG